MPRSRSGQIIERRTKTKGSRFNLRIWYDGTRHFVPNIGRTRAEAEQYVRTVLREMDAGVWVAPTGNQIPNPRKTAAMDDPAAYSLVRQAAQMVDKARAKASIGAVRAELGDAQAALYRAEDRLKRSANV